MPGPFAPDFFAGALKAGLSPTAALREFRAAGGSIRTQTAYRLIGSMRAELADLGAELGRPQHRIPTVSELRTWHTRRERGFAHRVLVYQRDRATGLVVSKFYTLRGPGLISRRAAVETAIGHLEQHAEQYQMQVIGGIHYGAYELTPDL